MEATEIVRCRGHPLVSGSHPTTFEVTTERTLTETGHCIIGIGADKGAVGLSEEFRRVLCHRDARLITILTCRGMSVEIHARGSPDLTLNHPADLVWRRSTFTCGRTIAIGSDTVAGSLPREFIRFLQQGEELVVTMTATRPG
jgi:hypothetical protein